MFNENYYTPGVGRDHHVPNQIGKSQCVVISIQKQIGDPRSHSYDKYSTR
jgi:hypothetical protein